MKRLFTIAILFTSLAVVGLAQDSIYEGFKVFDATTKPTVTNGPVRIGGGSGALSSQTFTATFTFTRKFEAATQEEADRKLAAYFAAYAESKGKSGLCVVAGNGACLSVNGAIVYDLAKVAAAMEEILTAEIDGAAKARFIGPKLEAARTLAENDFDKEEKPAKTGLAIPRRPNRRR